MLVVVVAAVGEQSVWLLPWPARLARHRPGVKVLQQRQQLRDVVAIAAGQADRQRDAAGVDEEVVL